MTLEEKEQDFTRENKLYEKSYKRLNEVKKAHSVVYRKYMASKKALMEARKINKVNVNPKMHKETKNDLVVKRRIAWAKENYRDFLVEYASIITRLGDTSDKKEGGIPVVKDLAWSLSEKLDLPEEEYEKVLVRYGEIERYVKYMIGGHGELSEEEIIDGFIYNNSRSQIKRAFRTSFAEAVLTGSYRAVLNSYRWNERLSTEMPKEEA